MVNKTSMVCVIQSVPHTNVSCTVPLLSTEITLKAAEASGSNVKFLSIEKKFALTQGCLHNTHTHILTDTHTHYTHYNYSGDELKQTVLH